MMRGAPASRISKEPSVLRKTAWRAMARLSTSFLALGLLAGVNAETCGDGATRLSQICAAGHSLSSATICTAALCASAEYAAGALCCFDHASCFDMATTASVTTCTACTGPARADCTAATCAVPDSRHPKYFDSDTG